MFQRYACIMKGIDHMNRNGLNRNIGCIEIKKTPPKFTSLKG